MNTHSQTLFHYILRMADNALINGHRLSEWCSKAPFLEEDLALTNMALDNIGRANVLLAYAVEVEGKGRSADDLAFRRGEREFYNNLITELPIGDFAYTIAKQFIISSFEYNYYLALCNSSDQILKAIAAKAVKELRYHMAHSRDWCYRLGLGTNESQMRLQEAFNNLWMYTGELFEMYDLDAILVNQNIGIDLNLIKSKTLDFYQSVLQASEITIPNVDFMQTGSRQGIHTEHLGHLLAEMQYLQRAYPDATW